MIRKAINTSLLYTLITAVLLGVVYPFAVTGIAHLLFREKADGQLIAGNGGIVGSHILGQPFTGQKYFHSRPSAAGTGYDATSSGGSNLGPTNKTLIARVNSAATSEGSGADVPVGLVTASGSGLDPDISPADAMFQVVRVAQERGLTQQQVSELVQQHTRQRQLGLLGEPAVNVLELNLALDQMQRK